MADPVLDGQLLGTLLHEMSVQAADCWKLLLCQRFDHGNRHWQFFLTVGFLGRSWGRRPGTPSVKELREDTTRVFLIVQDSSSATILLIATPRSI